MKNQRRSIARAVRLEGRHASPLPERAAPRGPVPCLAAIILSLAAGIGAPAHAALGQGSTSIEADRLQAKASVRQLTHPAYTVHELTTEMNGLVREYVSPSGVVFAVSWHGPSKPNLQQVLGAHFATVTAAAPGRPGGHAHQQVHEGTLVFESTGHMRSFHGRAYLTDAIPAGVTANDIQ